MSEVQIVQKNKFYRVEKRQIKGVSYLAIVDQKTGKDIQDLLPEMCEIVLSGKFIICQRGDKSTDILTNNGLVAHYDYRVYGYSPSEDILHITHIDSEGNRKITIHEVTEKFGKNKIKQLGEYDFKSGETLQFNGRVIEKNAQRYWVVRKDGKWGVIDENGQIVVPVEYDEIQCLSTDHCGVIRVKKDGKWGVIDENGKQLIPCQYDEEVRGISKTSLQIFEVGNAVVDTDGNVFDDVEQKRLVIQTAIAIEQIRKSLLEKLETARFGEARKIKKEAEEQIEALRELCSQNMEILKQKRTASTDEKESD